MFEKPGMAMPKKNIFSMYVLNTLKPIIVSRIRGLMGA